MRSVDVLVIGAGPAGATAALALARAGRDVLLCERGPLPRHRLCGEFLSPEAKGDLDALGLDLGETAAVPIAGARVTLGGTSIATRFERPGFGLSRAVFDAWLVSGAERAGASFRARTPVVSLAGDLGRGFEAALAGAVPASIHARAVVGAFGKRAAHLAGRAARRPAWVALEAHFEGRPEALDGVHLHTFAGGYLGLSPIEGDRTNVCGVAPAGAVRGAPQAAFGAFLERVPLAAARLSGLRIEPGTLLSESGPRFGVARPTRGDLLLCGDAAALPHPLGGDGMAMALRAGRLAAAHVDAFLGGRLTARALPGAYARAWRREFASRLRWCRLLHATLVRPAAARLAGRALGQEPRAVRYLVARTRGTPRARFDVEMEAR